MTRIGEVAQIGREIAGADEGPVNPVDCGDGLDGVDGFSGFDLHQDANVLVGLPVVLLDATESVRPRRDRDTARAEWWISRGRDGSLRLFGILDEGDQDRTGTDIEDALDQDRVVP